MPSLVCHRLSFAWPTGEVVLADLDVAFPAGRTGLVGRNGSGKTTLLRILAGELAPTAGSVSGATTVGYLPQQLVLDGARSVADVLGVAPVVAAVRRVVAGEGSDADWVAVGDDWDVEARAEAALADLGFEPGSVGPSTGAGAWLDRRIDTLSGGEVVLLGLASLFLAEPDVLLLDEPTNNLDRDARARLRRGLERWRRPVVVVSHDEELLEQVDTVAELRNGEVRLFGGSFSAYEEALALEQEAAERDVRAAQGDLRRQQRELVETATKLDRRQRYARTAYAQKREPRIKMNAAKRTAQVSAAKLSRAHTDDVAQARHQLEAAQERVREDDLIRIALPGTAVPAGREVARLDDVVLRHGVRVSLHLRGPERVGLVGPNGAGKTTLVDTLSGTVAPRSGTVDVRVPLRVLPQRLSVLDDDETVLDAVARQAPTADPNTLHAQLARFLLSAEQVRRPVRTLSGGERFRATLAALLLAEPVPHLLVLDEPTNNLDLDSVAQLEAALRAYEGALLVVSHDERFLDRLGLDRRLVLGG